jgi:tetratricopeptide (TPR) repeat protein
MVKSDSQSEHVSEAQAALLDSELFIKYKAPEKAIQRLRTALERAPRSVEIRERLREICAQHKHAEEAARQCLALASLYIDREEFESAHERLIEAKHLDPRINIASGLEAIRRARRPDLAPHPVAESSTQRAYATLAGDLSVISAFDAIQVVENAKLTGCLILSGDVLSGQVMFNTGQIVDAECGGLNSEAGFRKIVEITGGGFEFKISLNEYPVKISAVSNTNLILDALRQFDEESQ